MHRVCGGSPLLGDRYWLERPLEAGAAGRRYGSARRKDGLHVAIKERLMVRARTFRELGRLRREADFLLQLAHPQIPRLVEHFLVEDGAHTGFYLVSELCEGPTLGAELETKRHDHRSVLRDLASLLDVLHYLHTRACGSSTPT